MRDMWQYERIGEAAMKLYLANNGYEPRKIHYCGRSIVLSKVIPPVKFKKHKICAKKNSPIYKRKLADRVESYMGFLYVNYGLDSVGRFVEKHVIPASIN